MVPPPKQKKELTPEEKRNQKIAMWLGLIVLGFFVIGLLSPSQDGPAPTAARRASAPQADSQKLLAHAKPYEVIATQNTSVGGRSRGHLSILAPEAHTRDELAHTAIVAALDHTKDVTDVFIEPSKGLAGKARFLAHATFIPDGMGVSGKDQSPVWKVSAADAPLDPAGVKRLETMFRRIDEHERIHGYLDDESAIVNEIIEESGLERSEALPFAIQTTYEVPAALKSQSARIAKERKKAAEDRRKVIESQFSEWDGSHRELVKVVKKTMHDPKSFKHYRTTFRDQGDHLRVRMEYGGTNLYGAMVRNSILVETDIQTGDILEVLSE